MSKYFILIGWMIIVSPILIMGQKVELGSGSLLDVVMQLEKASGWSFNYDPAVLAKIRKETLSTIDLSHQFASLQELFQDTKVDFELGSGVVILLPPKTRKYTICGSLADLNTGKPLPYAHVYLDNYHGDWTDDSGSFKISKQGYKNEKVQISYLGYQDTLLYLANFEEDCLQLNLRPDPIVFSEEVIIRDYIFSSITQGKDYNSVNFDMRALNQELGALEKDVFKSVQFLPGVTSLDESASNISIRGSEPDQNLYLWEEVPLYSSGHFFGMISSINPFVVDELNIYNDVYSSSFDNRIGGVVDVRLLDELPVEWQFGIGTTLTELHSELMVPLVKDKLGVMISGRQSLSPLFEDNTTIRSYSDKLFESSEVLLEEVEGSMTESEISLDYYDLNAKVFFSPTDKLKITSAFFTSSDRFLHEYEFLDEQLDGLDSLDVKTQILANTLEYSWSQYSQTKFLLNYSGYSSEYEFLFNESDDPENDYLRNNKNEVSDYQMKLIHQKRWPTLNLEAGYVLDYKDLEYEIIEFADYENDVEIEKKQSGHFHHVFSDLKWRHEKWLFDFGSRLTYLNQDRSLNLTPRFALTHLCSEELTLRLSSGMFSQYVSQLVNFSQSDLNIENRIWTLSQGEPMRSRKFSFGAAYNRNNWLIDLDVYSHYSLSVPVLSSGQSSVLEVTEDGSSSSRGIELLLKKRWHNLSAGLSYHLGSVDFGFSEIDTDNIPGNNDQRHNLSFITHYKWKGWNLSFQYAFKSGLPYSEIDGVRLVEEQDEDYYEVEIEGFNDQRLSSFNRLDCTLGYKTVLMQKLNLDLQVSLFNLLGTRNTLSRSYILSNTDQLSPEPEIFEVEKFQLGRTPQVLFRISF